MKKNKRRNNYIVFGLVTCAIIMVLLYYSIIYGKKTIDFNINDKKIDLKISDIKKISYSLSDNNLNIEWISSNDNIKVNNNGEIIASDYGISVITGIVKYNEKTISDTCVVTVYSGDINTSLERIDHEDGYILMMPNSEFELPFTIVPTNAYITSVNYSSDDENIVTIENNKIKSKNSGSTYIWAKYNNIYTGMEIKVSEEAKENRIVKGIDKVLLSEDNLTMEMGDTKLLSYSVLPQGSFISNIEWTSSNENVVTVNDGNITAVNIGEAIVKLTINRTVSASVLIKVKASNSNFEIDYNPKTLIRIGETTSIKYHFIPSNLNDNIVYKSSNPSVVSVDNGKITGISAGTATITLSISNGKTKSYTINVLPKNGIIKGSGNLWGYQSLNAKVPVLADKSFYRSLAQSGLGVMNGNIYMISSIYGNFSYDINNSLLMTNNQKINLRIYYPEGEDLSTLNTLVYMGGRGETNFYGGFADIKNDPSLIKSAGIVALVAEGNNVSFNGDSGAYATRFIKAITKQQPGVKNSILGFSDGANKVLHASKNDIYDKIIIFSGYTDDVATIENAKDKEIIFMIGSNDGNYSQTKTSINHMLNSGYKNITIVSMGNDLTKYEKNILIINPGNLMRNGHLTVNVFNSKIIEYAND